MSSARATAGWRRHLEGWPLGLWVVFVSVVTALLVVPRDVPPREVPAPAIDRLEQRRESERESARAAAGRTGLPIEVRSVGEALRQYGRAALARRELLPQLGRRLRRLAGEAARAHGPERLLELRALQTQLWVAALDERPDPPRPEAVELAGGLLDAGLAKGWFAPPPNGADDAELGTLFRLHWGDVLGLGGHHPFAPSLNEWRVYYRFMLARPLPDASERADDARRKLEYVAALSQHDQDYPSHLARGILLYQQGAPAESALELRAHLELFPDGPWTLRARNHLAACGALLIE